MFIVDRTWIKTLPVITSYELFKRKKPVPDGLLSEQIFGPLHDYTCQCGKYWGPRYTSSDSQEIPRCPKCNVPITSSRMRAKQYARIKLVQPIINPLIEFLNTKLKDVFEGQAILEVEEKTLPNGEIDYELNYIPIVDTDIPPQDHTEIARILAEVTGLSIEYILLYDILVIPPAFRPATLDWVDDINKLYRNIIAINQELAIPIHLSILLYQAVRRLFLHIIDKMGGKGVIRRQCLGRELDLSGRAVVVPDPTLKVNEVGIPKSMLDEWGINFDRVIVNRQPTLHRRSIQAFKVVPVDDNVIRTCPAVNAGYNLDHDGDSYFGEVLLKIGEKYVKLHISELEDYDI